MLKNQFTQQSKEFPFSLTDEEYSKQYEKQKAHLCAHLLEFTGKPAIEEIASYDALATAGTQSEREYQSNTGIIIKLANPRNYPIKKIRVDALGVISPFKEPIWFNFQIKTSQAPIDISAQLTPGHNTIQVNQILHAPDAYIIHYAAPNRDQGIYPSMNPNPQIKRGNPLHALSFSQDLKPCGCCGSTFVCPESKLFQIAGWDGNRRFTHIDPAGINPQISIIHDYEGCALDMIETNQRFQTHVATMIANEAMNDDGERYGKLITHKRAEICVVYSEFLRNHL